tara:strand:- start:1413 stop:1583 length:171 start_codon:yes stop_codon:yes gene_type:complete
MKGQCYIPRIISIKLLIGKLWVIQRNIEAEEKWVLKKEELEKKIKRSNFLLLKWIK